MLKKTGKLLKYEFRFYFRILPPFWLILALVALLASFQTKQSGWSLALLTLVWVALIVAMIVVNIVLIIQRFTDNFLKNPGSLMFTLPVTSWALTASKAIAAVCIVVMSFIAILVSAIVYAISSEGWLYVFDHIQFNLVDSIIFAFVAIIMVLQQICLIYMVISASHILPRFRFVAGAIMYFAIMYFVEQPVFSRFSGPWEGYVRSIYFSDSFLLLIPYGIAGLIFAAIFYWATGFLLKTRLNLE